MKNMAVTGNLSSGETPREHMTKNSDQKQRDHHSDIQNPNRGTPGTNISWDKAQGNRGKQLDPSRRRDEPTQGAKKT